MSKVIAVDCDDVVAETCDAVLAYHNYFFNGVPIQRDKISSHAYRQLPEFAADLEYTLWYFDSFFCSDQAHSILPVAGAKDALIALKERGYLLYIVTARNEQITKPYTLDRVDTHFSGLFEDVLFASHHSDDHREKSELCHAVGATLLIDDSLSNALEASSKGVDSVLLDKPRNRHFDEKEHAPIKKLTDRQEVCDYLLLGSM